MQNLKHGEYAVNRHIAALITFILLITSILTIFASCEKTEEKSTIQNNDLAFEDNSLNANMLFSPIKLNAADSLALASYTVKATIQPATASNQQVNWKVEWASNATLKNQKISDYLSVTPDSDGSLSARVDCYKSFIGNTAVLSATTRDSKIKGTCNIVFIGKATDIAVESKAVKKSTTERGEYYEVYPKRTFTFDIVLSNVFNSVQDPEYVITKGGEGEVYFGTEYASADTTNFGDFKKIALNDLAGKFITSATIAGNTLTIKTGDMKLEDFYESSVSDGYGTSYYKRYVYEDEYDLIVDNDFKAKSKENITLIKSAYFYVNVKDKTSGLEKKMKLFFVDAPAAKISVASDLTSTTTTERGEFYALAPKKTYTFDIVTENIESPVFTTKVSGSGSAYFGTEVASPELTSFSDIAKKQISTIADKFITSAKIENGKLVITTGDKTLENYYATSSSDGYSTTYTDRYVFYDEFGTTFGTDYEAKSTENQTLIKSCYFSVRIYDSSSRASKTIKFFM